MEREYYIDVPGISDYSETVELYNPINHKWEAKERALAVGPCIKIPITPELRAKYETAGKATPPPKVTEPPPKRRSGKPQRLDTDKILNLHSEGLSLRQIAGTLGCSNTGVYKILRKCGKLPLNKETAD